jgi:hypothetical protein
MALVALQHGLRTRRRRAAQAQLEQALVDLDFDGALQALVAGADPNQVDARGCPPLIAVYRTPTFWRRTRLEVVAREGSQAVDAPFALVALLLKAGADPTATWADPELDEFHWAAQLHLSWALDCLEHAARYGQVVDGADTWTREDANGLMAWFQLGLAKREGWEEALAAPVVQCAGRHRFFGPGESQYDGLRAFLADVIVCLVEKGVPRLAFRPEDSTGLFDDFSDSEARYVGEFLGDALLLASLEQGQQRRMATERQTQAAELVEVLPTAPRHVTRT